MRRNGFTLIELVIVVVIIGILATLAVTQYSSYYEKTLGNEAVANLKLIAAAERIYKMETGAYYPSSEVGVVTLIADINSNLKLSLNEDNWDYLVSNGGKIFIMQANRQGAGGVLDCLYQLTDNDADGEPDPNDCCP